MSGPTASRVALAAGAGAVLAAALLLPLRGLLAFPVSGQDEGQLLVYPLQVLAGGVPNGTFQSLYGPTNLWVLAAAFKAFGPSVLIERLVGLGYRAVIAGSLAALVGRHCGAVPGVVSGLTCVLFFNSFFGEAAMAWVAALAFATLGVLAVDVSAGRGTGAALSAGAGVAFGLAVGCRADFVLPVALFGAVVVTAQRRVLIPLLAGFVVGCVPVFVNLARAGPAAVLRGEVLQPVFVSGPARRLPWDALAWRDQVLVVLVCALAFATVAAGVGALRRGECGERGSRDWQAHLLLAVGLFEVGLLPEALQRLDEAHLGFVACFIVPATLLLLPARAGWPAGAVARAGSAAAIVPAAAAVWLALPTYGQLYRAEVSALWRAPSTVSVTNDGRSLPAGSTGYTALVSLVRTVDERARPGDRLFVGPQDLRTAAYNDTYLYFLFPQLQPGSFYLEMDPGVANGTSSGLAEQIAGDRFVILVNESGVPGSTARLGPDAPNQVVHDHFREVGSWGRWTLLERH